MVLLTVVTTSNPHTLYFDHQIEKPSYIRLLSASLYSSWHNLKKIGRLTVYDKDKNPRSHLFFFQVSILWKPYPTYLKIHTQRYLE